MQGRTHYKLGISGYIIISCIFAALGVSFLGLSNSLTLAGAVCAAVGGLFPDIDHPNSLIGKRNPVYIFLRFYLGKIVPLFLFFVIFLFGIGILFQIVTIEVIPILLGAVTAIATYFVLCRIMSETIRHRAVVIITALILAIYNMSTWNDMWVYLAALLIAVAPFFPHRTFTHSTEGLIAFCFSAIHLSEKLGYLYLGVSFSLGYFSHLWLSDFFTKEGMSISSFVYFLGVRNVIKKDSYVYKVFGAKKSLNLMLTGSKKGNLLELTYVGVCFFFSLILLGLISRRMDFGLI